MKDTWDRDQIRGISPEEANRRFREEGGNELPSAQPRSVFTIAWEVVREPMFLLLVACGTLYLVLGDAQEALMLLGFVLVVMGITFYQERKTERALEALRDLSSPRALVIRSGEQVRVAGREVVRGDILVLSEGDRVPADAVLLECTNLLVDESLLTGESVPVRKVAWDGAMGIVRPGGDDLPFVYSGTLIVQGQGIAEARGVGIHTEIGKIGKALQKVESEDTALQRETRRLVRIIAFGGSLLCLAVVLLYGIARGSWLTGLLAGIALAMALLPEEFPVVLTIFPALGAWRISKKQVLTRRIHAIENLGAATVLCVDKTGTLTLNRMSVAQIYARGELYRVGEGRQEELPESMHEVLEFSILASNKDPFDPMELAIRRLGEHTLARTEHWHPDWTLVQQYPLSRDLLAVSHVWKSLDGGSRVIAAKGASEAIADLCHLDATRTRDLSQVVRLMAEDGLRVIAVARANLQDAVLPHQQHDFEFELVGLIGLSDPIRPAVPAAIGECYSAGIRVIMITGDYPGTARSIAREISLTPMDEVITGAELDRMDEVELQRRIRTVNLFARVVPEQKLRLVNALKANGEVVAMTGDGVNDAPALKSADIGIAMGARGTDVAREAADLVLLQDDFSSIVEAIRLGRRIFDNLRKAMAYILAIHVPIAGVSLIPVLFNSPFILAPLHIVLLELIIDPACSIVFEAEAEEFDVMRRPPRKVKERLINRQVLGYGLLQGAFVLLTLLAVYGLALSPGRNDSEARALTFTTLVAANVGLIFINRSWTRIVPVAMRRPNAALWYVTCGALGFIGLVLYVPFLCRLFHFSRLHADDLAICLLCGALSVVWFEVFKIIKGLK